MDSRDLGVDMCSAPARCNGGWTFPPPLAMYTTGGIICGEWPEEGPMLLLARALFLPVSRRGGSGSRYLPPLNYEGTAPKF